MSTSLWNSGKLCSGQTRVNLTSLDVISIPRCGKLLMKPSRLSVRTLLNMKHGGGNIMVWASIAANGVRKRSFIDGIMNAESYK